MTTATRNSAPFENAEDRLELGAELLDGFGGEGAPRLRLELAGAAILLDLLPGAFDRVFLGVQQMLDEHIQLALHEVADRLTGRFVFEQYVGHFARDRQLDAVALAQRDRRTGRVDALDDRRLACQRLLEGLPLPQRDAEGAVA